MADPQNPAGNDLEQKVDDLEQQAAPKLDEVEASLTGAIWDVIKDFFTLMAVGRMQDNIEYMPELVDSIAITAAEKAERQKTALSSSQLIDRLTTESTPRAVVEFYESLLEEYPLLKWLMGVLQLVNGLVMVLLAETSATKELFWQSVWKRDRPALIPTESVLAFAFKNPELLDLARSELEKYGYRDDLIDMLLEAATEKLGPQEARAAFLRGEIDEDQHDNILKSHRLSDEAIDQTKKLYEIIPGVQDLIVMAVREVFSPEIAERFGQFEDFPEALEEIVQKIGLTPEWARNYWAAHWSLPSVTQAFEMYHRNVISYDDLAYLLRALDIMPFWRDKLLEISHNPYTRVDVRRMHAEGILDDEQVFRSYLDLGYDEEKALNMTAFTVAYNQGTERELTKTDIVTLYKRSGLTRDEALEMLQLIGYSEDNAALILERAALEVLSDIKQKTIEATRKLYVGGRLTESQAHQQLGPLDLAASEVNQLLQLWDLDKQAKFRYLTFDQIKQLYAAGIINKTQVKNELLALGYESTVATWLTDLVGKAG